MRLDDLPLAVRRKVEAQLADAPEPVQAARTAVRRAERTEGLPLTCTTCLVVVGNTEGKLRKHQDQNPTHSRYEWRPPT